MRVEGVIRMARLRREPGHRSAQAELCYMEKAPNAWHRAELCATLPYSLGRPPILCVFVMVWPRFAATALYFAVVSCPSAVSRRTVVLDDSQEA